MFSKYRCYSLHTENGEEKEPLEQQNITQEPNEQQQQNTQEQEQEQPFHCLKKRKSILIFSLTNTLYNECAFEVHRLLNEETKDVTKSTERVITRLKDYCRDRFGEDIHQCMTHNVELTDVIQSLLETILKTGTDTIKLKQIYTAFFFRLARCMSRLLK